MIGWPAIPEELRNRAQWVLWRQVLRGNKNTKIPFAVDGSCASTTNPTTWSRFGRVRGSARVGFVFSALDPYVGIDIDNCVDQNGDVAAWAQELVARFDSYTEVSPSGRGLHIIVRGSLHSGSGRKLGHVEVYDRGRYFCMTGNVARRRPIAERQAELDELVTERLAA